MYDKILALVQNFMIVCVYILIALVILVKFGNTYCEEKASKMEVPYSYTFFQGCMIQIDNKWIPLDNYRVQD